MNTSKEGRNIFRLLGGVPAGNDDGIGANSQVFEYTEDGKTTRVLIDLGLKLPSDFLKKKHPEFDGAMPDFRQFFPGKNGEPAELPLDFIVVTHAHADHLDGLVYMTLYAHANKLKMPKIIGSQYTKNTLYSLLRLNNLPKGEYPEFEVMQPCKSKKFGDIEVKTVPVSHPTPESYGYILETPNGGLFHQGDNRSSPSHTGVGGNNQMVRGMLRKSRVTHATGDSTSSGNESTKNVTMRQVIDEIRRFIRENKGKKIYTPVIARSIENLLPILIAAKEEGVKLYIDGNNAKTAFKNWQGCNTVYYMEKGELCSTSDKKMLKELRANKGIDIYCADDFRETVWDYDDVEHANVENYIKSVGHNQFAVLSGAFGEKEKMQRSGAVRVAEGTHLYFPDGEDVAHGYFQRLIASLRADEVIEMIRMNLRNKATVYLNFLSEPVLREKGCDDILKAVKFIVAQLSGHNTKEGTRENGNIIASNAKNCKDFERGLKLQIIAVHGNEEQRENTKKALAGDDRIECHNFCNGDVLELAPGATKLVEHIDIADQKFLGIINEPESGEIIFKPLDGVYEESLIREDLVLAKLSPSSARAATNRNEKELARARAMEEEGGKASMNKYIVSSGKNAGKGKLLPRTKEERRMDIEGKQSRRDKHKQDVRDRKEARRQKQNGFSY